MRLRNLFALTVLTAGLCAPAERAEAFEFLGAAWTCDTIRYCINPAEPSSSRVCFTGTSWFNHVQSAVATWNAQGTAFQLVDGHPTPSSGCAPDAADSCRFTPTKDGQNTISMALDCNFPAGFLAVAMVWTNVSTCSIIEADMCFSNLENTGDYWYLGINPPSGCVGNCFDAQTVALHELGHWIGLGHEDDLIGGVKQVMHSATGICDFRRTLTGDDAAGLGYVHDGTGTLDQPARCNVIHSHPTYATSTKSALTGGCGFEGCYGTCSTPPGSDFDGDGFCDSLDNCPDVWNRDQADGDGDGSGALCDCDDGNPNVYPGQTENCSNTIDDNCDGLADNVDPTCATGACCNVAGDADNSGSVNIGDVTFIVARIFLAGPPPVCCEEGDADGAGSINIADATHLISFIFSGGPAPICGPAGMACGAQ